MRRHSPRKEKLHVSLDPGLGEILDAIASRMGEDPLYPVPSRSDLLNKAARLLIAECKKRDNLRETVEAAEARLSKIIPLSTERQTQSRRDGGKGGRAL